MVDSEFIYKNLFRLVSTTDLHTLLKDVPLFRSLSNRQIKQIAKYTHLRKYRDGEVIFRDKEPGLGMYIIKSGAVKITTAGNVLAELESGEFFGELALIDEINRSATAAAAADTELIAFFRPDLISLCERDPYLGNAFLLELAKIIALRLRKTTEELHNLRR